MCKDLRAGPGPASKFSGSEFQLLYAALGDQGRKPVGSLWASAALPSKDPEREDTCVWFTAGTQLL